MMTCGAGKMPRSPKQIQAAPRADSSDSDSDEESAAAWADMNLPDMDDATRQLIMNSIRANAASDEEEDESNIEEMLRDDQLMPPAST